KILRSPVAHARILSIDSSKALALPGVICVLTGADLADLPEPFFGSMIKDRPVLAVDRVRYAGEPVAVVAAASAEVADEACALIEVGYENLPSVLDCDSALDPDSPLLHENPGA